MSQCPSVPGMGRLLEVRNLEVHFQSPQGIGRAVDGVDFAMDTGDTLGLVGESGCGKSVTALSIMGLIASPAGRIASGRILFDNQDLVQLNPEAMRRIRGREISMIFQEPMTSLNPVLTIGRQVAEPLMTHRHLDRQAAWDRAADWLEKVRIPDARRRMNDYPHQLSGGMRQRVMIAMAMVCRPRLLIADEPTTALDVSIQSQILSLMDDLKRQLGMSLLLITHDLGVVAQTARRVVVMYAGWAVETAAAQDIFARPFHPYTRGLLRSIPRLGGRSRYGRRRLSEIPGRVPSLVDDITGCKFAPRCPHVFALCRRQAPPTVAVGPAHVARCWLADHPEQRKPDA